MSAPIPWEQMTHEQLHAAVNTGPGPGVSMAAEQTWRTVHEIIEAGEARMNAAMKGSGEGWQGAAGDAARSGFHELNSWARDAAMDAHNTAAAMVEQAVSSGRLRSSLPAPNTEQLVVAQDAARNAFDKPAWDALQEAEAEATWRDESARHAMRGYYFHSMENRQLMDYWAVPPTVLVEAGPAGGPSGSGSGGSGVGSGSGSGVGGAGQVPAGLGAAAVDGAGSGVGAGTAVGAGAGGVGGAGTGGAGPASGSGATGPGGTTAGGLGGAGSAGTGSAGPGASGPGSMGTGGIGAALGPGASAGGAGGVGAGGAGVGAGRAGTASPGRPGAVAPGGAGTGSAIRGPKDLPAGAGGRGSRPPGVAGSSPGSGVRPVVPRVPVPAAPSPTWRDVVAATRGEAGGNGGRPGDVASGLRGGPGGGTGGGGTGGGGTGGGGPFGAGPGGGGPNSAGPGGGAPGGGTGSGTGTGLRGTPEAGGRTGAGSHGMYPPMGGGGVGNQGEDRRRASYLIDDTGAFDVDLPCVEPVIGADIPPATTRARGDAGT